MIEFRDRVVAITGAAGGLGKALAKECLRRGARVALIDIDERALAECRLKFVAEGLVTAHVADVSHEEAVVAVRSEILRQHGGVNILINNAAVSISQPFQQMTMGDFRRLFEINFWGSVYCSRHFLPDLLDGPDNALANVISDFALMGFPGKTAYGSSKSALMGFTYALKTEVADKKLSISVVVPPPLHTGLVLNSLHVDDARKAKEAMFLETHGMPLERAARLIVDGIGRKQFRILVGGMMNYVDVASRLFPTALHGLIARRRGSFDFI